MRYKELPAHHLSMIVLSLYSYSGMHQPFEGRLMKVGRAGRQGARGSGGSGQGWAGWLPTLLAWWVRCGLPWHTCHAGGACCCVRPPAQHAAAPPKFAELHSTALCMPRHAAAQLLVERAAQLPLADYAPRTLLNVLCPAAAMGCDVSTGGGRAGATPPRQGRARILG